MESLQGVEVRGQHIRTDTCSPIITIAPDVEKKKGYRQSLDVRKGVEGESEVVYFEL